MHVHAQALSHVQLFETPWTVAHQAPLSMGFFQASHPPSPGSPHYGCEPIDQRPEFLWELILHPRDPAPRSGVRGSPLTLLGKDTCFLLSTEQLCSPALDQVGYPWMPRESLPPGHLEPFFSTISLELQNNPLSQHISNHTLPYLI